MVLTTPVRSLCSPVVIIYLRFVIGVSVGDGILAFNGLLSDSATLVTFLLDQGFVSRGVGNVAIVYDSETFLFLSSAIPITSQANLVSISSSISSIC